MTAEDFNKTILSPALDWFQHQAPKVSVTHNARVMLLAIAGQESGWKDRIQSGGGPAHGYWQFERMGGVNGVLTHPASAATAKALCANYNIPADPVHVWGVFTTQAGDNLAAGFARLLLWTDPAPLPSSISAGWSCYLRLWRPGKPRPHDWTANWDAAAAALKGRP